MQSNGKSTVETLETELSVLAARVGISIDAPRHIVALKDIAPRRRVKWTHAKGLYVFAIDGSVQYIGRALGAGMGERVRENSRSGPDDWLEAVAHPMMRIRLYIFSPEDVFWAAAFEARLIDLLRPPYNRRIS